MLIVQNLYDDNGEVINQILTDTNQKSPLFDESEEDARQWRAAISQPTAQESIEEDIKGLLLI